MIVRAFRLTDKAGNAALKTLIWLSQLVVAYADALFGLARGGVGAGGGLLGQFIALVVLVVLTLYRAVRAVIMLLVGGVMFIVGVLTGNRERGQDAAGSVTGSVIPGRRTPAGEERRRRDDMLRRAEELSETVVLVEDPLKTRNRTLSAMLVVALAAVVALLIWATSPRSGPVAGGVVPPAGVAVQPTPVGQLTPFATSVPTVTPRPESLRIGGSLAYTVRDAGQSDIWVSVIGFEEPIQVTSGPAEDRDPSWSPDGHYLAFESNRDGNWELYVQDVRTGQVTRLTYTLGYEGSPSWSPDGQWLVYEAYIEDNLDIYITRVDGTQGPIRLTYDPAPDFSPVWSAGGRELAYVSRKGGDKDIYLLPLDDPTESVATNLTGTPDIDEDYPAWSPDGLSIAYSALVDGLEAVYVKPVNEPQSAPLVIDRGHAPAWAPDGNSLVYAVDQGDRTILLAGQYRTVGVASQAVTVPVHADSPAWTDWRPQGSAGSGVQPAPALFEETISFVQEQPPYYRLVLLGDIEAPNPYLSDRVNDSFAALRQAVLNQTGVDYLGDLEDAFWAMDRLPEPGQERLNWHLTGRAFALNRNLIYGFPPPLEMVREDIGVHTYWRIYARAAVQDGQLGEPLRELPWDFAARSGGDVEAYEQGGRLRASIPAGYYVDLTQLFEDYGWNRLPADRSWRYNFGGVLFWEFVRDEGLSWNDAMLEIYSAEELDAFLSQPTPFPTSTLAPPTSTPAPTRTPTPVPPDQPTG